MSRSVNIHRVRNLLAALLVLTLCVASGVPASGNPGETYFSSSRLQEIILDHIETNMPWEAGNIRVEFLGRVDGLGIEGDTIDYRVEARRNENYIGQTSFSIRFYDKGLLVADQSFRVRIEVVKDFVVSARHLDDGTILTSSDVSIIQRWVDRVPRGRIGNPDDVTGMMIRGSIAQNAELHERMLRQPQLVRRGDVVRVVLSRGALQMETVGISAETGALGDRIRIRKSASNNLFYARVVDEAVVRVDF